MTITKKKRKNAHENFGLSVQWPLLLFKHWKQFIYKLVINLVLCTARIVDVDIKVPKKTFYFLLSEVRKSFIAKFAHTRGLF